MCPKQVLFHPPWLGQRLDLKKTIEWRPRQADWASPSSVRVFMAPKVRWGGVGGGCWTGERQGAWEGGQQGGQRGDRLRHHWPLYKPVGQHGHFIFGTFSNEICFTVNVTRVPQTFWNLTKNWKLIFSGQKYQNLNIFHKTYMKVLRYTFFFKEKYDFLFFPYFLQFFEK